MGCWGGCPLRPLIEVGHEEKVLDLESGGALEQVPTAPSLSLFKKRQCNGTASLFPWANSVPLN